jgi:integrase
MAWVERRGGRYRVRERRASRKATVQTFDNPDDARAMVQRSERLDLTVRRRLSATPPHSLAGWVEVWLPAHTASPATMAKYESLLRVHILPAFGRRHLDAITRNDVKAFAKDLSMRLSPASVRSVVTVLGLVLREAIDEHYLFFDPTARLRLRDGPAGPRPTADPVQVQTIADRMPDRHAAMLVITAAYTGMRFGELAGLTRVHLDLDRARIQVAGDAGALHEVGGRRWLGPPKSPAAVRDIRLPAFLVDGLDRHLRSHPFETVFCTGSGGWMWRATFTGRTWRPACDGDTGRGWDPVITGFRFHDMRHTHRTWLDEDSLPESLKSQRLGHQIPGIRGVYAHVTEPMQTQMLERLQKRWLDHGGHW